MQAPNTIDASAESRVQSAGADLDTCRAFAIAAMKTLDKTDTRVGHAKVALIVLAIDDAMAELAS